MSCESFNKRCEWLPKNPAPRAPRVDPFPEITEDMFFDHPKHGRVAKLENGDYFKRFKDGCEIYANTDFNLREFLDKMK